VADEEDLAVFARMALDNLPDGSGGNVPRRTKSVDVGGPVGAEVAAERPVPSEVEVLRTSKPARAK